MKSYNNVYKSTLKDNDETEKQFNLSLGKALNV